MYPRLIANDIGDPPAATAGAEIALGDAGAAVLLGAALRESELPIYAASAQGVLVYANPACQALLPPECELGAAVSSVPALAEAHARVVAGEPEHVQTQSFQIHGQLRHFVGRHRRIVDRAGGFGGVVGLYVDISNQRHAESRAAELEERYDELFHAVSDWVWETDAELNLTYASPSIGKVLGEPPERLKGRPFFGLGSFEDTGLELRPVAQLAEARIPFRNRRFVVNSALGGPPSHVQLSGVPIFDRATGHFLGYRGTGLDVTATAIAERERLESRAALTRANEELRAQGARLERALAEARTAATAKSLFLARMSHELRTPLNAIIGFSEAANQGIFGSINSRYADYFGNILRAGRHLLTLVDEILDTIRIYGGKLELEPQALPVAELVDAALMSVRPRAADRRVRLEVAPGLAGRVVRADPHRTRQILVNLLDNGVKFTPAGGQVRIDCVACAQGMIDIVVADEGLGIPPDQQKLVFEPFHQIVDNSHLAGEGGIGLGLTLSRQIAQAMGGDILLESESGRGSRLTVRLPAA